MTKRIFTGIIVVALIIMLACTGLIMGVMYDYVGGQIDKELQNEASLVRTGLELDGTEYLKTIERIGSLKSRVTLIDAGGEVLFDSMNDETTMENHLQREEIREAMRDGEGQAVRESDTMASDTRYYAVRLSDGNFLRLSTDHYSQLGLILDTFGMVVVIVGILVALAALISHTVSKSIVKPINEIDLDHPDIPESYDELSPLLHRIHQQNAKIRRQINDLKRQQEEFAIITENMREGLLIIDRSLEVLLYNRSALQILDSGHVAGQGVDRQGFNVLSLNRSEPFRAAVDETLQGQSCNRQLAVQGQTYEIIGSPVFDEGKVTGAILVLMNVTQREMGERMRREFTSNVSHELKTPLTSIYGVSDMLASGMVKPEDVGQFGQTIREEAARLMSLIDDVMRLSQLDENSVQQEKADVDLYLLASRVLSRLQPKADEKQVSLELVGESAVVSGVDYVLDEIVYNLCENAIKYNKDGGRVSVSVNHLPDGCMLQVSDTGVGIPQEALSRVFERFYRVDKSRCSQVPGTGLGMSIVKHGVAYHGGTIHLESVEGAGTTVTVKLPR